MTDGESVAPALEDGNVSTRMLPLVPTTGSEVRSARANEMRQPMEIVGREGFVSPERWGGEPVV